MERLERFSQVIAISVLGVAVILGLAEVLKSFVADRFHVMKLLNDELDNQQKAEKRAAKKNTKKDERQRVLKGIIGSKYALLKHEEDLNER
jgi:cell shape-determining protein MreC